MPEIIPFLNKNVALQQKPIGRFGFRRFVDLGEKVGAGMPLLQ